MAAVSPADVAAAAGGVVVATAAGRSTGPTRRAARGGGRGGRVGRRWVRPSRREQLRPRPSEACSIAGAAAFGSGDRRGWLGGRWRRRGRRGGASRVGRGRRRGRQVGRRDRHHRHGRRTGRRVEQRELELEAETADAAPLRVDRGEAMGGSGQRAPAPRRRRRCRAPRRARRGCSSTTWSSTTATSRPRSSSASRVAIPAAARPSTRAETSSWTASASARPRSSRTAGLVDGRPARGKDLVEHRLGVAHAAGGQPGDEVDRTRLGVDALRREDPSELPLDLLDREAPDVVALEPRQDRRRELLGMGRGEDEDDEVRRLLERLQERVPGVLRDLVGLIEDVDLPPQVRRGVVDPVAQLADVGDAAVARGVDLDEVHRPALADRDARLAAVARVAVLEVRAVDGLGEDPGERRLARPARARRRGSRARPGRCGRRCAASRRRPSARRSRANVCARQRR